MATDTQVKTIDFYSRGDNELVYRRSPVSAFTPQGAQYTVADGVSYSFAPDGKLSLEAGQDLLPDGPVDPETREPTLRDAAAFLRAHRQFNIRFWEEGREPDRPLPTEKDFYAVVTRATAVLDPEPIEAALMQERETHNRTVLLEAAEGALDTIRETRQALEREREAQQRAAQGPEAE